MLEVWVVLLAAFFFGYKICEHFKKEEEFFMFVFLGIPILLFLGYLVTG